MEIRKLATQTRLHRITRFMERYVAQKKCSGMVALVYQNNRNVYFEACGLRDIATQEPMTRDTIFRIYSMTKPVTSVALMQLLEQGHCHLDDPASHWIPAMGNLQVDDGQGHPAALESPITIRHLLTHTAGFSYGFMPEQIPVDREYEKIWKSDKSNTTIAELLDQVLQLPLIAQPGSRWHYSVATDICGRLVEIMSDRTLDDYFRKFILDPLDMPDTSFCVPREKQSRFATLYGITEDEPLAVMESPDSSPYFSDCSSRSVTCQSGGSGLVSTAADFLRFSRMILNKGELDGQRILSRNTVKWMTMNHIPDDLLPLPFNELASDPMTSYGFGLGYGVNIDQSKAPTLGSTGDFGWGGLADTYHWIDPSEKLIGILLQQFIPALYHSGRRDFKNLVYQAI